MSDVFPERDLHAGPITLRPFTADDVEDTRTACADEVIQRWIPLPRPYTLETSVDWCTKTAHTLRESGDGIHFAISDPADGRLLGAVGLKRTDWQELVSEVGYWIAPWARGRGIAARATHALGRWLLTEQGFERLELKAAVGNIPSRKTAIKAGLHREGILRNAGRLHTGRVDVVLYSLTPSDL
ncbi:GNAT family N-acetyltransferase [Embleya scabrispora]|uniref:GNAT family N-acetyltransferase n=1 Tax=Embleya scabrispora TaxID=159449 RepID=UPI0003726FA7|nr:GNAT family N-acetyltransferase [Embleya scabrispora]